MGLQEMFRRKPEYKEKPDPMKLAFLISHKSTGSNLQATVDAIKNGDIDCVVQLVVSEKPDVKAIEVVEKNKLPLEIQSLQDRKSQTEREAYGKRLAEVLNNNRVQMAILEGASIIINPIYFKIFKGVTINVHPGLIPDEKDKPFLFPDRTEAPWNRGLMTEKAVRNFLGMKYAGSTWHVATEETDFGPVLNRVIVNVEPNDAVETLYPRLKKAEHSGPIGILKNPPIRKDRQ